MTATDLKAVLPLVEAALREAEASAGSINDGGYSEWFARRDKAMQKLSAQLAASCGAKITRTPMSEGRVRICGIASTSTTGIEGALKNWITAAHKRLATDAGTAS